MSKYRKGTSETSLCLFYVKRNNSDDRKMAERVYDYLVNHFNDKVYGGVYWELDQNGIVIDSKKQIFAQALAIYSLSAYYKLTSNKDALARAMELFNLIEEKAKDFENGGYITVFERNWKLKLNMALDENDIQR